MQYSAVIIDCIFHKKTYGDKILKHVLNSGVLVSSDLRDAASKAEFYLKFKKKYTFLLNQVDYIYIGICTYYLFVSQKYIIQLFINKEGKGFSKVLFSS